MNKFSTPYLFKSACLAALVVTMTNFLGHAQKPTAPISTIKPLQVSGGQITLDVIEGNGTKRAVFMNANASATTAPVVDNTTYGANTIFGWGSEIGTSGWFCVFNGASTDAFTVEVGLKSNTTFKIHVVDYNGSPGAEKYNIDTATDNPITVTTLNTIPLSYETSASTSAGFTPIPGIEIPLIDDDDKISDAIPIGFTFTFEGVPYTNLRASSNGFISFNPYVLNSGNTAFANNLNTSWSRPAIAPLWDDLSGKSGTASYATTGSAPNRIFTIQYLNWKWNFGAVSPNISFQIKLYEINNKIEFHYRPESGDLNLPSASIGLAFSALQSFISLELTASDTYVHTVSEITTNSMRPSNTQVFAFTPVKLDQEIELISISNKSFPNPAFDLEVTTVSKLPVSYTSSNTAVATISGKTVTIVGAGITTITATLAGDANFNSATSAKTFTVFKGNQIIWFDPLSAKTFGDPAFALTARASSALPVTYTSSNTKVATIVGSTVTIVGAGTSNITASQGGNGNFEAAPNQVQTLSVNKAGQSITFNALPAKTIGDASFTLGATASSGLGIEYTSSNAAVAIISGNTVTITGLGSTNITASQGGNVNYNPASNVTRPFTVKASQTITFAALPARTLGDAPFTLTANSSSSLPVAFSTSSDKVTIADNQVTLLKPGSVTINANQEGNTAIGPAPQISQTFCINPAKPSFTFTGLDTETPLLTSNAISGNQWLKDGVAIAGATNATLTVPSAGMYSLIITVDNCKSAPSDSKAFIITEIEHGNAETGILIYPNPIETQLTVDVTGLKATAPVSLSIFDIAGHPINATTGNGKLNINMGAYPGGTYLLRIQSDKHILSKKIIKK